MDTLSLAEAIYYDPEYSGSEDDMTNIRAIQAAIDVRIADARAAGYAEAKQQLEEARDSFRAIVGCGNLEKQCKSCIGIAFHGAQRIERAIARAATKEPT